MNLHSSKKLHSHSVPLLFVLIGTLILTVIFMTYSHRSVANKDDLAHGLVTRTVRLNEQSSGAADAQSTNTGTNTQSSAPATDMSQAVVWQTALESAKQ